jgi:hypothetical protein
MDPRDVYFFTNLRAEQHRRDREHAKLVQQARLYAARGSARVFRIFPLRRRESDATTD